MKAAVFKKKDEMAVIDVPDPVAGVGEVVLKVHNCGICGSDLHFAKYSADVLELNNQIDGFGGSGGKAGNVVVDQSGGITTTGEGSHGIEASMDFAQIERRPQQPCAQQALAHGRDRAID